MRQQERTLILVMILLFMFTCIGCSNRINIEEHCIDGVTYFRPFRGGDSGYTVKIDKETLQPIRCKGE